ncbi:MAG: serine/threonine protein kinase [Myxococcales bacterium]|nr:serine/threonine protein kinase [Myxococcales bacterium]
MAEAGPASASSPGEPAPEPEPEPSRRQLTLLPGGAGEHTGKVLVRRYELLRELGRGGMASVYEARFLPSERRHVAVKILRRRLSRKPESARRFAREFKILDALSHPGLVEVRDFDRDEEGRLFMVMERLEGRSLDKIEGPLAPERVVVIGLQLCDVLAALHETGVIHRDLKPSNVILLDGPGDRVKLVDLGIARLEAAWYVEDRPYLTPPEGRALTRAGLVLGTPRYVPPEAGDAPPTILWDIYALGVMLWQLATGRQPPASWREPGRMDEVDEGRFGIPKLLERALRGAMSVEPERRFGSVVEMREELEVVAAELGLELAAEEPSTMVAPEGLRSRAPEVAGGRVAVVADTSGRIPWWVFVISSALSAMLGALLVILVHPVTSSPRLEYEAMTRSLVVPESSSVRTRSLVDEPELAAVWTDIAACIAAEDGEQTSLDLTITDEGRLVVAAVGPELDPMDRECVTRIAEAVRLELRPGGQSTQRVSLDALRRVGSAHVGE